MENRERYKRLIMFLASAVIIAIETLLFAYIWYKFYAHKEVIGRRFDRGNHGEAAGSAISSLIGGFTTTAYPQNVALLKVTDEGIKIKSPMEKLL